MQSQKEALSCRRRTPYLCNSAQDLSYDARRFLFTELALLDTGPALKRACSGSSCFGMPSWQETEGFVHAVSQGVLLFLEKQRSSKGVLKTAIPGSARKVTFTHTKALRLSTGPSPGTLTCRPQRSRTDARHSGTWECEQFEAGSLRYFTLHQRNVI